ncbi:MAG: hypothetical protein NUV55_11080 [Sulfuricaulis sp.]|uniref:hypothetical protein n=1 Tax=Sulfuricaulis sp. TaxID=2003553 RepID=UPI0025E147FC|nr:hypothetical protein [Sulfuricaulis sp.]MCR4347727.1 hypothetical protein [Sulfuricaulis sp.]
MANQPNPDKAPAPFWPVIFAEVEEAQLKASLAATPAERLVIAEELLEFVRLAQQARKG